MIKRLLCRLGIHDRPGPNVAGWDMYWWDPCRRCGR